MSRALDIDLTMDATVAGTTTHHFRTVHQLRAEAENARIYGGDHFRVGGSDGTPAMCVHRPVSYSPNPSTTG